MRTLILKTLCAGMLLVAPIFSIAQNQLGIKDMASSEQIIQLIQNLEKLKLTPYRGASGKWVVGYGHLLGQSQQGPITKEKAVHYLKQDLKYAENTVKRLVKTPINQHEFDALVSLTFNIGSGAFANSTVLKRLNNGNKQGAADAFLMWNRAGGKRNKHLDYRRHLERDFFLGKSKSHES